MDYSHDRLGLNSISEFKPQEKIIEYNDGVGFCIHVHTLRVLTEKCICNAKKLISGKL